MLIIGMVESLEKPKTLKGAMIMDEKKFSGVVIIKATGQRGKNIYLEEARMVAAQCWCDEETSGKTMDPALAEAVAVRIAAWMDTAAQNQRNTDYYRGLLVRCGRAIGERAFMADDGNRHEDVLCAKIPEIVAADYADTLGIE